MNMLYFIDRLADPQLLNDGVWVTGFDGWRDIAIPVGASRRGGCMSIATKRDCRAVMRQLRAYPSKFPNLRVVWADTSDVCHNVCWGDPEPMASLSLTATDAEWIAYDRQAGAYYGYSAAAIESFITEQWGAVAS